MPGILLLDEDRLVSEAIANFLSVYRENNPVETSCNLTTALSTASRLRPRVVFTELEFSKGTVFDLIPRLRAQDACCRIVILTAHDYDSEIDRSLQAGVDGIILKYDGLDALNTCLGAVGRGEAFFSDGIRSRIRQVDGRWRLVYPRSDRVARLSRRERQLLSHLGRGASLKEAAADMQVCYKTADNQKASLMRKLDVHDRVELALFAIREKFVSPERWCASPPSGRVALSDPPPRMPEALPA